MLGTYKITHMSVAGYPILKLKPRTNNYQSVFFFLFNVFLYIHETSKWDHLYIHHRVNELYLSFYSEPWLVVQDIWQLKYKLFCKSNHFSFLLFLTYSFYVLFNIGEYEN